MLSLNQANENEITNQIAREIIADIEEYADKHLEKYQKFTLNVTLNPENVVESSCRFFSLISSLRDVSRLGRKLLESVPLFNVKDASSASASPTLGDRRSINTKTRSCQLANDDATSEDLLAALIESSSTDDFLVLSTPLDTISSRDMILMAMIYIKSHDCFTLAHDIQGVAIVLRRVKFIILNILAPKNQMELITKLLTSIGRYAEMNYVFDLIRDCNQFEILLSKGVEKTPELRIALFNYVKKNPEFYPLVTLNFSMFREIAESLEASATNRLNKLISNSRRKTDSLNSDNVKLNISKGTIYPEEGLNLCLVELVDASDCFAKAACYRRSNNCERNAKLIALQIGLLSTGTDVLNVPKSDMSNLIVSFKHFSDAHIIAEAYDFHRAWGQALFKNVILDGRLSYLDRYLTKYSLSDEFVEEVLLLYEQHLSKSEVDKDSFPRVNGFMQAVLAKLSDVEFRYRIYTRFNFDDAKRELLLDPAVDAHLRDLRLV